MNNEIPHDVVEIMSRLIRNNEILGHKLAALTFVCAYILKERCMATSHPLVTLARMEGELGGTAEAIASKFAAETSDPTRDTGEVTRLIDSLLLQASDAVTQTVKRDVN